MSFCRILLIPLGLLCLFGLLEAQFVRRRQIDQQQRQFQDRQQEQYQQQQGEIDTGIKNGGKQPIQKDDNELDIQAGGAKGGDEEHQHGEPYSFSFLIPDHGAFHYRRESSNGDGIIRGEYSTKLPDGRVQIVEYISDWKNGHQAKVSYIPADKVPDCPIGTRPSKTADRCLGPDETEEDIQPGGQTPKPCPAGTAPSKGGEKCVRSDLPDETEEDIQPGGFTPKPCPDGTNPVKGECPSQGYKYPKPAIEFNPYKG